MSNLLTEFPKHKCWAVVGVSENSSKFGYKIYFDLKNAGYEVYGINPRLQSLLGDKIYKSLAALPKVPDVVNIVVPPDVAETVIDDCVKIGAKRVWFQPGSSSESVIEKAKLANLDVVYDACIMIQKIEVSHTG